MTRTPARFTQADIARATRAAIAAGAKLVELKTDGTILIRLDDAPATQPDTQDANPWDKVS